jgi:hypothetical protein
MSLRTADFFSRALTASEDVTAIVGDRIFLPARPTIDEQEDTIPYIIIEPGSLTNISRTKDDSVEGQEDSVNVSILCVAESHDRLMDLCEAVRDCCIEAWEAGANDPLTPVEWQFSTSEEIYDQVKPCNFITLVYQCTSNR